MYRIAHRAAFGIGAWFLVLVAVPHPAATADELPQNACGIRAPFSLFQDMIEQGLQETLDQASDIAGISMSITDIQIVPRLGRLGYETVDNIVRPARLPAGSPNDTNTSDDDFIEIILTVDAGGVTTFDLHVAIAFPQSRPDMVDPEEGTTCMCREYVGLTRYVINTLPPCDPPEDEPNYQTVNCLYPYWTDYTDVPTGQMFDVINYDPTAGWEGAGYTRYNQHYAYPELVEGITDNNGDPVACERVDTVMCSRLNATERQDNNITNDNIQSDACVLCIDEHWSERPVWIDPDAFPNLLAVQVWDTGAGPIASYYIDEALKHGGFKHPHPDVQGWPFERGCCLQRELGQTNNSNRDEPIDQIAGITGTRIIPGLGPVDMGQLIRDSGGVRISETKESLILMIPPVNVEPNDYFIRPDGEQACSRAHIYPPLTTLIPENLASQITSFQLLDAPKILDFYLKNLADTRDFAAQGMQVTCNHAEVCPPGVTDFDGDGLCDCWELGITDVDGDGICDDVDYCLHTVTGANCDSDGDGYGDAPQGMVHGCLNPPFMAPFVDYGQTLEAARQFYCGGCDNCPKAYNPYVNLGDCINPNPGRWPWWAAVLIDDNGDPVVPLPFIPLPSRQEDRDGDSIGDACDEDADGDGVHVEHDCDDMNEYAYTDLDGDGICDSLNHGLCRRPSMVCTATALRTIRSGAGRCCSVVP